MTYQYELKQRAAVFYNTTLDKMDLPYEAWKVLRDHFLSVIGE